MIALILAAALAAPVVTGAEVRPTFSGSHMTAAYMTVTSAKADRLLGVSCTCAASVELHQTITENGVARMTGPAPVDLPAGRPLEFPDDRWQGIFHDLHHLTLLPLRQK